MPGAGAMFDRLREAARLLKWHNVMLYRAVRASGS